VLDDFMDAGEPVYAVYASRRHLSVRVRSLLDHIAQQIEPAR
jgi:DNA-binding transcriptional LysR family regulator